MKGPHDDKTASGESETENGLFHLNITSDFDEFCIKSKDYFNVESYRRIMFKTIRLIDVQLHDCNILVHQIAFH